MRVPRKFVWLGADDNESTHLALKTGEVYSTGDVSMNALLPHVEAGRAAFIEDEPGTNVPEDVVLVVQKGTISLKDLLDHLDKGLTLKVDEKKEG